MEWKDIGSAIEKIAPVIGGAVGGPAGLAVGGAVSLVIKAFGLADDATPEQVKQAIESDPEASLKLMVAQNEYQLKQRDQDIGEMKAILADVQSARTRQTDSEKATGKRDINLYVLAWTIVGGFFMLLGLLLIIEVPRDQNGVIFMLFGALSTGFGQVLQYFFGSSKGSADKTAALVTMNRNKAAEASTKDG